MKNIVIQAYGNPDIINQSKFCILSALKFGFNGNIIIYTDTPEAYLSFENKIKLEPVNDEMIKDWKGPYNFVHRLKIKMLQDYSNKYSGKMLYMDSDTYFLTTPDILFDEIENGKALMHECEGQLSKKSNPILKKTYRFVKNTTININGKSHKISPDSRMWNAGVIGLADEDISVLDKVLELNDAIYQHWQKHVVEQFSFSYYLQTMFDLKDCKQSIMHYWGNKEYMNNMLRSFFDKYTTLELQLEGYNFIDLSAVKQGKGEKKSWLSKLLGK